MGQQQRLIISRLRGCRTKSRTFNNLTPIFYDLFININTTKNNTAPITIPHKNELNLDPPVGMTFSFKIRFSSFNALTVNSRFEFFKDREFTSFEFFYGIF